MKARSFTAFWRSKLTEAPDIINRKEVLKNWCPPCRKSLSNVANVRLKDLRRREALTLVQYPGDESRALLEIGTP
jgi:valyl-tRNA synthetase